MVPIVQIDTPQGRKYQTPVGLLPSVTTILQATMPLQQQQNLQKWRSKQTKTTENRSLETDVSSRGTRIHEVIAAQLQGKHLDCPDELLKFWHPVRRIIAAMDNPLAIERAVYHPSLLYAGTLDLIALWQEKVTIFDWKTSKRAKCQSWMNDASLQVAAYKAAFEQIFEIQVEQAAVVVISPNRTQLFEIDVEKHWNNWLIRLETYYSNQH